MKPSFGDSEEKEIVRRCWYSHDGHWFMSVAGEFGMETANRLNRRALRGQGRTEARRVLRALGAPMPQGLDEFLPLFEILSRILVPVPETQARLKVLDERTYEITIDRCFVHQSVARAGNPEGYLCAVFDRIAGWHDGAGLPLAAEPPALPCAKAVGRECRRVLTIR